VTEARFERYVGIDYSGAKTPASSLPGLRVYVAERGSPAVEVRPPEGARRYWSRRGIAEWLVDRLREDVPTLVGIDHAFSFPRQYFEKHALAHDWPAFLEDFQRHWPTDGADTYVDFVREGTDGNGTARTGNPRWRRVAEERSGAAKSVFHFDVPGQVAKSTHAGLPWLRFIREQAGTRTHFWPFDGWAVPRGKSAIAEVYPRLWSKSLERDPALTEDQHDARSVAEFLRRADRDGTLDALFEPKLSAEDRALARFEGWILGEG
jgi:hypothetical protein